MALTKDGYEMTTAEMNREIRRLRKKNAQLQELLMRAVDLMQDAPEACQKPEEGKAKP